MDRISLADDIFTIEHILTATECEALIDRGERLGFEAASVRTGDGPKMLMKIRNNDRAEFVDPGLADDLWSRVGDLVLSSSVTGVRTIGLNDNFRFYRYDPGQQFKRHKDGVEVDVRGNRSRLTFLIYLNEGCEGGETIFSDYVFEGGVQKLEKIVVTPKTGQGLLFAHERWHEGAPLITGRKYVLRTEVMYVTDEG